MPGSEDEAAALLDTYLEIQRDEAQDRARAGAPRDNGGTMERALSGAKRDEAESKSA